MEAVTAWMLTHIVVAVVVVLEQLGALAAAELETVDPALTM
jgi:hypothetical protein